MTGLLVQETGDGLLLRAAPVVAPTLLTVLLTVSRFLRRHEARAFSALWRQETIEWE